MRNIIVSGCLVGIKCKYNGDTNKDFSDILKDKCNVIAVCPEQMGGLSTPRIPLERVKDKVLNKEGIDVTENYRKGAEAALKLAELNNCSIALLKAKSPSCGKERIYDGTFTSTLTDRDGVTVELFKKNGIRVFSENEIDELLDELEK